MLFIIIPGNVSMIIGFILPVAMFDVLENDYANPGMLFEFEPEEWSDDIFSQIRDIGYETHSSILNLGTLFVLLSCYFLQVFACLILFIYNKITKKGRKTFRKLRNRIFWSSFFGIILDAYIEFLIASYLNFTAGSS